MRNTLLVLSSLVLLGTWASPARGAACTDCHANSDAMAASKVVDANHFKGTPHNRLQCVECHTDYKGMEEGHKKQKARTVACTACHEEPAGSFGKSVHGSAAKRGDTDVPKCQDCHGTHRVLPPSNPDSRANPRNLEHVCIQCHTDPAIIARHHLLPGQEQIRDYELTVHWGSREKVGGVAYCTSCHGGHSILPASDANSTVNRWKVAGTCGKCHDAIYSQFKQSVHGQAYLERNKDVPVCTDCHGAHTIKGKASPDSPSYPTHIATMCLKCHNKERLSPDVSIPAFRGKTYFSTFHGIASSKGDVSVANCASCHGSHNIRKSSDPLSTVNPANIPKTCGVCHPGAGVNFSLGKVHTLGPTGTSWIAAFIANVYTLVIAAVLCGLFGLIALDLYGRWLRKRRRQQTP